MRLRRLAGQNARLGVLDDDARPRFDPKQAHGALVAFGMGFALAVVLGPEQMLKTLGEPNAGDGFAHLDPA